MDISLLIQGVVNGLCAAGVYVLTSLGLALVLSIMNIVQLAHGEMYMLGAYITYFFITNIGTTPYLGFVLSTLLVGALGILLERTLFRPVHMDPDRALIVSVGLILIIQNVVLATAGGVPKSYEGPLRGVVRIWRVSISWERIGVILIAAGLVTLLFLFLHKTKAGQAMVAIPQDRVGAVLQGIDINRMSSLAMAIGCALAAIAGSTVGALFSIAPTMGGGALMKAIAVIILGGLGSLPGAVLGGLILGMVDGLIPLFFSIYTANLVTFGTVIGILILRPSGLLGHG